MPIYETKFVADEWDVLSNYYAVFDCWFKMIG